MKVGVLRLGNSNVVGVVKVLKESGREHSIVSTPNDFEDLTHLIIPGVGSFDYGIKSLHSMNLFSPILAFAEQDKPILGICLGMHLLCTSSSEGTEMGLDLISGKCTKFESHSAMRAPHLGWNTVNFTRADPLMEDIEVSRFYFNHSYALFDCKTENILSTTFYGEEFVSGILRGKTYGVQFHPEKSHNQGRTMIKNFLSI
jgi:glutamine amidotransferase